MRVAAALLLAVAAAPSWAADPAGPAASPGARAATGPAPVAGEATVVLAVRSIGSRRGQPPERRAHAALLVRIPGREGGFIVQGGPEPVPGSFPSRSRLAGWVIPCADPSVEFGRAAGAWWGEPEVRVLPVRELATFTVPGLDEARMRALAQALDAELRDRTYRLDGPSSNSFVSLFIQKLGRPLPPVGGEDLPGWGWRP
jgi:hypothetical protein